MPISSDPILVLVRDLIFASKISGTAQVIGVPFKMIRQPEKLAAEAGSRLIVDLNLPGAIAAAGAWRKVGGRTAVGFVSHVDAAAIAEAREAGIDRILARSQFVEQLTELLKI